MAAVGVSSWRAWRAQGSGLLGRSGGFLTQSGNSGSEGWPRAAHSDGSNDDGSGVWGVGLCGGVLSGENVTFPAISNTYPSLSSITWSQSGTVLFQSAS